MQRKKFRKIMRMNKPDDLEKYKGSPGYWIRCFAGAKEVKISFPNLKLTPPKL